MSHIRHSRSFNHLNFRHKNNLNHHHFNHHKLLSYWSQSSDHCFYHHSQHFNHHGQHLNHHGQHFYHHHGDNDDDTGVLPSTAPFSLPDILSHGHLATNWRGQTTTNKNLNLNNPNQNKPPRYSLSQPPTGEVKIV